MIKKPSHVNLIYQGDPADIPINMHFFMPRAVWQKVHDFLISSEDQNIKEVTTMVGQMLDQLKTLEAQAEYAMIEMAEEIESKIH